jgi:hypothetical protein
VYERLRLITLLEVGYLALDFDLLEPLFPGNMSLGIASRSKLNCKALPWSVMDRLHQKGYTSDPATKNKSVSLSDEGAKLSKESFEKLFAAK